MEPQPFPPPTPPPTLASALAHLRSLLSAASSALAALPSPLLPNPATTPLTTLPSPPPTTTTTSPVPPPSSAVLVPLPASPTPYSDCPGVVRVTPAPTPASSSLPAFLAAECADFSSSTTGTSPSPLPRILPSELGLLRRELDSWGAGGHHLPGSHAYAVTRVTAAFRFGLPPRWEAELRRWVVASSPRYGVVIDTAVRDHVWVLVRLCLKAVAAEAGCLLERARKGEDHEGFGLDPKAVWFECPRLVEGVSWLGVQLGVLYGEGNGRVFAVAAVKEAVLRMGYCLTVGVGDGIGGGGGGEAGASGHAGEKGNNAGDVVAGPVFLSQVAAAIAALYEKTKALRAQRPSKYQLLLEYSQALERGHLERSNRPNYRPILEYDGILSRRVYNQESGGAKTREELLAEERDYKRRRMSYRGKKVKRDPIEILRDIIDEHMEEIKQAGGIGCLVETPSNIAQNMLKSNSHGGTYQGSFNPASSTSYDKAALGSRAPSCENSQRADSLGRVSSRSRDTRDSYKNLRYETDGNRYQNVSEHESKRSWSKGLESEIDQSYPHRYETNRRQRNSNDNKNYACKYNKDVSDYCFESSDCTAWSTRSQRSSGVEYDHMLGGHSDRSRTSQKRHRSISVTQDQFGDRYDPQSTYSDGDPPTSMLSDVTEGKHEVYHDEVHRRGHHERKRDHHR
ncbi:U11/U12 small nuclear ribonucleoprotein 48 kDa protein [Phragmites australis]|uniref:U11/U12 small nuclear ribonucleoprotein 48 kDa protein n=1 Tax=Phragmites australis TaxID=29695 RepID=UPI002D790E51|nr:U11/U12 small nuclear ribonucleoprotein 48 kDa protein [Phragmites australis]XP_062184351.1 U11/U12 small nuclear ribonucleoprotein 48 kDa protein [Phragmites australis]